MSMSWYPDGWIVDVPNPGHGELAIIAERYPFSGKPLVAEDWEAELTGADIGAFLLAVTARAAERDLPEIEPHPEWGAWKVSGLPTFVTPAVARDLLPTLQRAVVLAIAGTDRFERSFYDAAEGPHEPLCVHCDKGTCFTPGTRRSDWCDQYGHTAFGMGASRKWEGAQEKFRWARERWENRRARASTVIRPHVSGLTADGVCDHCYCAPEAHDAAGCGTLNHGCGCAATFAIPAGTR